MRCSTDGYTLRQKNPREGMVLHQCYRQVRALVSSLEVPIGPLAAAQSPGLGQALFLRKSRRQEAAVTLLISAPG